jgi:hypothetical protein
MDEMKKLFFEKIDEIDKPINKEIKKEGEDPN